MVGTGVISFVISGTFSRSQYFGWSVVADCCSLYLHFPLNPGSSIMYDFKSVLAISHERMIVNIKNNASCNLKYAQEVQFSDSSPRLSTVFFG